jgi:hypothetical protein
VEGLRVDRYQSDRMLTSPLITFLLISFIYHHLDLSYEIPYETRIEPQPQTSQVGTLNKNSPDVGTGLVGAPACGDVMKLQIQVDDAGIITDVKFKTFGCGSAIASSSYMTERVRGLSLDEAGGIKNTEIAKELW